MALTLLSIQSHVVYGHVGNSAAVFPLQRLGAEVLPLNTVQFSNNTGYPAWRGRVFTAAEIDECVVGLAEVGAIARCDGVFRAISARPRSAKRRSAPSPPCAPPTPPPPIAAIR